MTFAHFWIELYARLMPLRRRFCQLIMGAALLASTTFLCAQTTWTAVSSPTTQDLWSVCYGGNTVVDRQGAILGWSGYVVVGSGGTILTSVDGLVWTARASGTTAWLVGTNFCGSIFVIVGDQGTILTSPDAITWTPRASGTTQRLNGVAFGYDSAGRQRFLAIGEGGTACTSTDGITWVARNAGVTGWLRGVINYSGGFAVSGQNGTLLTTTDGVNFTPINTGTQSAIEGLTSSPNYPSTIMAVGENGLVGTLQINSAQPATWSPATVGSTYYHGAAYANSAISGQFAVIVGAGGAVAFTDMNYVLPSGSRGFSKLQLPRPAELYAVTRNVAVGQQGTIWTISDATSGGIDATSMPAFLGRSVTLQAPSVAGTAYQWLFNDAPLTRASQPTLSMTNLQSAQAGIYSVRLNTATSVTQYDYRLDVLTIAAFSPNLVELTFRANIGNGTIYPLPDGRLLLYGDRNFSLNNHQQYGLVRLNRDGTVDPSFDLGTGVRGTGTYGYANLKVLLQPDGKIILTGTFSAINGTPCLNAIRLNADGSLDSTFAPDGSLFDLSSSLLLLPKGQFMLFSATGSALLRRRLTNTGAIDPTFGGTLGQVALPSSFTSSSTLTSIDSLGRPLVAVNSLSDPHQPPFRPSILFRLQPDGTLDLSFSQNRSIGGSSYDQLLAVGDKIMYTRTAYPSAGGLPFGRVVGRLNADGSPDLTWPEKSYFAVVPLEATPPAALLPDGSVVVLVVTSSVISPLAYQLQRIDAANQVDRNYYGLVVGNDTPGEGWISQIVALPGGQLLLSGSFSAINSVPRAFLARIVPDTHVASTRLTSLSVRANAGSGDQTLIVGFAVSGSSPKTMLVRGVGPGLAAYGVNGTLADPQLTLFSGSTAVLANDNWSDGTAGPGVAALTAQLQDFPLAPGSKDAADIATLSTGLYTMHITGQGGTGVALAEAYDADPAPADFNAARVVSFSARTQAGAADQTLTAGFAVSGSDTKRLLIRAVGPGLTAYNVSGVLADPVLTLYQGNTVIATNDDWNADTSLGAALQTAAQQTGAFALNSSSKDSALLVTLPPGIYTAQVSGKNGATGVALVEVYEAP